MLESKNCKPEISSFPMAMSGGTGSILNDTTVIVCGGIMFNELHNYKCYYSFQTNFISMNFSLNKYTSLASSTVKGSNLWITGGYADGTFTNVSKGTDFFFIMSTTISQNFVKIGSKTKYFS